MAEFLNCGRLFFKFELHSVHFKRKNVAVKLNFHAFTVGSEYVLTVFFFPSTLFGHRGTHVSFKFKGIVVFYNKRISVLGHLYAHILLTRFDFNADSALTHAHFGKLIRSNNARRASRKAKAKRIGASPKAVNFWESGKVEPSAKFICALADTFEVTCDYLLGREDDFGNVNVMRNLTEKEKFWLDCFQKLSPKQFDEVVNYINYLVSKT